VTDPVAQLSSKYGNVGGAWLTGQPQPESGYGYRMQLKFYASLYTKQVILEMLFPADVLVITEETKLNVTQVY